MLIALLAVDAAAHAPGAEAQPQPVAIVNLLALSGLYAIGYVRLWRRSPRQHAWLRRRGVAFVAAGFVTAGALFSPLDPLADRFAWAHMVQHLALMMLAAPLWVLAAPVRVMVPWGLPGAWRAGASGLGRTARRFGVGRYVVWQPLATWALFAGTLWVWHLPRLYEQALADPVVHDLQHLGFVGAAALFWGVVLDPVARRRLGPGLAIVYLFATQLQAMALGVLMTLSPRAWYPAYGEPIGLTLVEDQQLAGAAMWMPGCVLYALVAAGVAVRWLAAPDGPPAGVGQPDEGRADPPPLRRNPSSGGVLLDD